MQISSLSAGSQIGRVLHGRFRIDALIGRGSMGAVFEAWDSESNSPCAIKLLQPSTPLHEPGNVRFMDEARLISQLCHPNIVEIWDHGVEPDGTCFLAMELLKGQELYSVLQTEGSLLLPMTLDIVKQIGSALHTIHLAGIVHRDIKPHNIVLLSDARAHCFHVKVIDFGLAKLVEPGAGHKRLSKRGSDGMLIGTPAYLPPEAWTGISADVDARADQWALAVLTYRMLSGRLPFEGDADTVSLAFQVHRDTPVPLRDLVAGLPPHVDAAVARALSRDKRERFPTILEFVRALHNLPLPIAAPAPDSDATAQLPASSLTTAVLDALPEPEHMQMVIVTDAAGASTRAAKTSARRRSKTSARRAALQPTLPSRASGRFLATQWTLLFVSALAAVVSWSSILYERNARSGAPANPACAGGLCQTAERGFFLQ